MELDVHIKEAIGREVGAIGDSDDLSAYIAAAEAELAGFETELSSMGDEIASVSNGLDAISRDLDAAGAEVLEMWSDTAPSGETESEL
jgi:hypothetical protein